MTRPSLIVVCGAPASGKTTLARRLAGDLRLPLLEKDAIKESLAGTFEPPDREASRRVGWASLVLLYDLAQAVLRCGASVMIECNFDRHYVVEHLQRLAERGRVLIVQCEADPGTIERRYRQRASEGGRHAVHFDLDALPDLLAGLERGAYDLTSLGYPSTVVRIEEGYKSGYGSIVEAIRHHLDDDR